MCSAVTSWFLRCVTCCTPTAASSTASVGTVTDDDDDEVHRKRRLRNRRPSDGNDHVRHRYQQFIGQKATGNDAFFCLSACRLCSHQYVIGSGEDCTDSGLLTEAKVDRLVADDSSKPDVPDEFCVGALTTDVELVCCCERCDSVTDWTCPRKGRSNCLVPSVRLQNYLVACGVDRTRTAAAGGGTRKSDEMCGSSSVSIEGEMSISLLSTCDVIGVDLLAGHRLKPNIEQRTTGAYNEVIGCIRPPPNRTIGHLYVAAASAEEQLLAGCGSACVDPPHRRQLHGASAELTSSTAVGCACCQQVVEASSPPTSSRCCVARRRNTTTTSKDKLGGGALSSSSACTSNKGSAVKHLKKR